ncbi:MAG: hypothetical protein WCC30_15965 [Candidatus Dormiibacterota bacterium]
MQSRETSMELKALSRLGWSVTALAREYGLSRTTIYKELASPSPRHYERTKPTALTEAQLAHVERRLTVCPNVRGTDLHAELRYEYGYDGSYPAFQRHLRLIRPAQVKDPEIRFETGPSSARSLGLPIAGRRLRLAAWSARCAPTYRLRAFDFTDGLCAASVWLDHPRIPIVHGRPSR